MMSNSPLLSVIVPVYNTAPWLRRCLDSICAQSYRNLEILCVNDGSTDNSAEILAEYAAKDARIKVFTQANAGLSAARNTALDHATGEWVTGVDSDDYLYPGVYEQAVGCITDEVDMVFFGVQNVAEDGTLLPHNPYFDLPEAGPYEMTPELAEKLNVCFWSKLWRRRVIEDNDLRFPHGLFYEDEAMYCLACPYVNTVTICPAIGYAYTQRKGSIMLAHGLTSKRRLKRLGQLTDYTCREYVKRALMKAVARAYLVKSFARIWEPVFWLREADVLEVRKSCARIIWQYGLQKDNYLLERIAPVLWWQRPFISRESRAKLFRIFGFTYCVNRYSEKGALIRRQWIILDRIWALLKK